MWSGESGQQKPEQLQTRKTKIEFPKHKQKKKGKSRDETLHRRRDNPKKLRSYPSTSSTEAKTSTVTTGVKLLGQFFRCHENEHWRKDCTEKIDQNLCKFAFACSGSNQLRKNTCKSLVGRLEK